MLSGVSGSATRLVVHDAQGIAFAVHTVYRSADIVRKHFGRSLYLQGFRYFLFHAFHTERGVLQVVAEQLPQIGCDYFGVDKLCAVVFGLLTGRHMEKLLLESGVYVCLQPYVVAEQLSRSSRRISFPLAVRSWYTNSAERWKIVPNRAESISALTSSGAFSPAT